MKKASSVLIWTLFILLAFRPVGILIASCFGYSFELISMPAYTVAIAVLSVCTFAFDIAAKDKEKVAALYIVTAILTPLSLVSWIINLFACCKIVVAVSGLVSAIFCCCLTVRYRKNSGMKTTAAILYALLILFFSCLSFFMLIFGNIGQNTVVRTLESPSGKYCAQVIDSDQGVFGGDTLVDVYEKRGINLILFKIEKKAQRVYFGEWGEFENMKIRWKDDNCLVINSVEYEIE